MSEWLRLLSYAKRYWASLAVSVFLMALVGASQALIALLIGPIFDRVLSPVAGDAPVKLLDLPLIGKPLFLQDLTPFRLPSTWVAVSFGIVLAFVLKGVCDYFGNYLVSYAGFAAVTDLRNSVFRKVLRQGAVFFEANSTGRLMSSIMSDIDKIQVAVSHILADLLRQSFTVCGLLFVVLHKDWKLGLVSVTVLPFVLLPTARLGKRIRRSSRSAQDNAAEVSEILQETLSGHQIVKAFAAESRELDRFSQASGRLFRSNLRYVRQQALASPLIEIFGAITIVALLAYARAQIQAQNLTAGEFTSFVIALLMLYEPVKRLTGIHNIFQQALGASQKVFEYLDQQEQIVERPGAVALGRLQRSVVFDSVTFSYPAAARAFRLSEVSFEVQAGELIAIVGPSGAGKSTLVSLLPRFYDPVSGGIRIDGVDLRDATLASLREQIAIVSQDTFLFNDTIAANIAYGKPDASREEIEQAAASAIADEFVKRLPQGFDTMVGERGVKLSGGQRQRIAIARALLKNAPILVLDEATSHLDSESELLVQQALANLMTGRTAIVIAHRLSTIRRANRIVVLENGRIVQTGSHEELLARGGTYKRLYELQFLDVAAGVDS